MPDLDYEPTIFGRDPNDAPPKPSSKSQIRKLGAALDRVEDGPDHSRQEITYIRAINARDLYAVVKEENSKRAPRSSDEFALSDKMHAAQVRVDEMEAAGPDFRSRREYIDAKAAAWLAETLYEIAETKFKEAERAAKITGIRPRSRSDRRLVSDGYVRTGRYKMINGARVPVLEKIE